MSALPVLGFIFVVVLAIFIPRTIAGILVGVIMQADGSWALAGSLAGLGLIVDCFATKAWLNSIPCEKGEVIH